MFVPLSYNVRSITQRWRNTGSTILAIALAVAVIVCIFAMQGGIEKSLVGTGTPGNVLIMRAGATAELNSVVTPEQARMLEVLPGLASTPQGRPFTALEYVTTQNIPRAGGGEGVNVSVRGIQANSILLRPQVRVVEGRWFTPGVQEAALPTRLSKRFGLPLGGEIQLGRSRYRIVGLFEAGGTAYDSEIWADVEDVKHDYNFEYYSVMMGRMEEDYAGPLPAEAEGRIARQVERLVLTGAKLDPATPKEDQEEPIVDPPHERAGEAFRTAIKSDNRLAHSVRSESDYYGSQTFSAKPLQVLGTLLALLMGPGAALAAMNAMFAAIASRTREIGTLRVLGFGRFAVLVSFAIECIFLGAIGGVLGCGISFGLMKLATSFDMANFGTMNFASFSEIIFQFRIEPAFLAGGFVFAICIGVFGGLLPAFSAARLPVLAALKR